MRFVILIVSRSPGRLCLLRFFWGSLVLVLEEILKWGKSLETKAIDEPMEGLGLAEEEKYFGRMEIIGQLMKDRFVNLDPDYADDVCEKIYQELYDAAGKGE